MMMQIKRKKTALMQNNKPERKAKQKVLKTFKNQERRIWLCVPKLSLL